MSKAAPSSGKKVSLYAVVNCDWQLVPSYPDLDVQGGCEEVDGSQPVVSLFTKRKVAKAFRDYLQRGRSGKKWKVVPVEVLADGVFVDERLAG